MSNPGPAHLSALRRVLAYVGRTAHFALRLAPDSSRHVEVYSDASWLTANSTSGGLILYRGAAVAWWTRRQKSVSASTTEAEYFAAALASREAVWALDFIADIGFVAPAPAPLYLDSKAALELTRDPSHFKLTKHILRHAYELRDRVARNIFEPKFVDTANQLADILTKALRPGVHEQQVNSLLVTSPPSDGDCVVPHASPVSPSEGGVSGPHLPDKAA